MSRVARASLIGGLAAAGWMVSHMVMAPPQPPFRPTDGSTRGPISTERLEGVRSTVVTPDGHRLRIRARKIESLPVRLLGPVRLGFVRSAVASDVHIDFDARDSTHISTRADGAQPSVFTARALGLSHGSLVGLELDGLEARIVDPIGRVLTVRARRCEMESASSLTCFKGTMDFGPRETVFARARFDGMGWQILETPRVSSPSEAHLNRSAPGKRLSDAGHSHLLEPSSAPQCSLR